MPVRKSEETDEETDIVSDTPSDVVIELCGLLPYLFNFTIVCFQYCLFLVQCFSYVHLFSLTFFSYLNILHSNLTNYLQLK